MADRNTLGANRYRVYVSPDGGNTWQPYSGSVSVTAATSATVALTNVGESATSVTLLAANAARLSFSIFNDSDGVLVVKPGATASLTSMEWRVMPRSSLSTVAVGVNYTGRLDGIWETTPGTSGHASARIAEFTT